MTAEEFLQKLEAADLAPPEIVASLRKQVAAAKDPIAPAAIAKLLVEKGHLTVNQSNRLLGNPAMSSIISKAPAPASPATPAPVAAASTIQKKAATSGVQKSPAATSVSAQPPSASQIKAAPKPHPKPAAPSPSLSSSNILDDVGLTPLDDLSLGSHSSTSAASSIHSGTHPAHGGSAHSLSSIHEHPPLTPDDSLMLGGASSGVSAKGGSKSATHKSPSLSGSHVLEEEVGLAPLGESSAKSISAVSPSAKSGVGKSSSALDDLGMAPDDGESRIGPPPGSLAAKALAEKEAQQKQNAADAGHKVLTAKAAAAEAASLSKLAAAAAAKSAVQKAPGQKPPAAAAPVAVAPLTDLDELPPLDDLTALDLNSLTDLPPLDAPSPLGGPSALAPGPLGPGPLGPDPLGGPLGGPADLGALAAQTARLLGQPTPQALAAVAAANESRTTMLVAGLMGGAALLAVVVGLAIYFWPRGSGMAEFQAAEQAYTEKQYLAAIEQYDALLRLFPRHEQASLVKVHRGMCRVHNANPTSGDWSRILPEIREAVNGMAVEPQLTQVHAELAPLLIQQCEALAEAAIKLKPGDDLATRLQEARAALALCNDARLVPSTMRPWQKLALIEERLQLLARDQERIVARDKAKGALAQPATAGDVAAFYKERAKLLTAYPELAGEEMWSELGPSLAAAAIKNAKHSASKVAAAKDIPAAPWLKNLHWTKLAATPLQGPEGSGKVVVVTAAGAIYGVDSATGQVRWSRYVAMPPGEALAVSSDGNSLFVVDRTRSEFACLSASTGDAVWLQPLSSPAIGKHALAGNQVFLSLASGAVRAFDVASGEMSSAIELPQPAQAPCVAVDDGKQLVQVGEQGLLYVLSGATLQAERAIYLGHDRGAVRFAPIQFHQQLVVAARRGEQTDLYALTVPINKSEVKRVTIDGVIGAAMLVVGQRLMVPTETGKVHVLELGDGSEPLRLASTLDAPAGRIIVRHLTAIPGGICAADFGCGQLKFNSQGKLEAGWAAIAGETCDTAATLIGETLLVTHFNYPQGIVWASAVNATDGEVRWQAPLSASLTLVANADAANAPHALPLQNIPASIAGTITTAVRAKGNFDSVWLLKDRVAHSERGRPELLTYARATEGNVPWQALSVPLPGAALAGLPALVGQQLLVPLADGSIQCLHPQTGAVTAAPFVLPGTGPQPLPPVILPLGEDGKAALVFDGARGLVKIGRADEPQPHWAEQGSLRLSQPLASPPVVIGDTIFAVDRQGLVQAITLPDFAVGQTHELRGAAGTWGPHRCDECVLLATDSDELLCLDAARVPRWQHNLPQGPLAGPPLANGSNVVLLARSGLVEVRSLASGDVIGNLNLRQPLAGPGLVAGNTLWVATASGSMLQLTIPTAKEKESP